MQAGQGQLCVSRIIRRIVNGSICFKRLPTITIGKIVGQGSIIVTYK